MDWLAHNLIPLAIGFALPLIAASLRVGARKLRAYTRKSPSPADDQIGEKLGDAIDGAADALSPRGDK